MTRFVVDCGVVVHLASEGLDVSPEHELLAPTLLRSQTLSTLHESVHRGEILRTSVSNDSGGPRRCAFACSGTTCSGIARGGSQTRLDRPRRTPPSTSF